LKGPERLARCLIIGCGCRGSELARALTCRGHVARGTTRSRARAPNIQAAGAEAFISDPKQVATIMPAIDGVAVVCILLGSARGTADALEALHGPRLEMLLARLIDTTVRGVAYEARGSVSEPVLAAGSERVRRFCERSRVPFELLETPPDDHAAWVAAALAGVQRLMS